MPAYTLDANAIIYYAGNDEAAVATIQPLIASRTAIYVPTIVIVEVFSTQLSGHERAAIETILTTTQIVPLYEHIARTAAELRHTYRTKLPDVAIAATALVTGSTLLTRNVRDFRRISGLMVERI